MAPKRTLAFHYIADKGIFGLGTQPRNESVTWSRRCGAAFQKPCPGSDSNAPWFENATGTYHATNESIDTKVPHSKVDLFSSGALAFGNSVSSVFDIQYRAYNWDNSTGGVVFDNGSLIAVGDFRAISTVALDNKFEAIEGLVVDTVNGGGGFRNHSAPPLNAYGSVWAEDLLFIQPITECVNTNLTFDFSLSRNPSSQGTGPDGIVDLRLTDRGGFAQLNLTYPAWDCPDTQKNPEMRRRAYRAAWLHNVLVMAFMNVTNVRNTSDPGSRPFQYLNSAVGKSFPLQYSDGMKPGFGEPPLRSIQFASYGSFLDGTDRGRNSTYDKIFNTTSPSRPPLYSNPFGINRNNFSEIYVACQTAGHQDLANITNFAAKCGTLLGVARRTDGADDLMFFPGFEWTAPIYSCITATQALLKTVTFRFNATDDLSGLSILDIADKKYPSEDAMPLWAVENMDDTTGLTLEDLNPIWGLVSPNLAATTANISTLRRESLLLPGFSSFGDITWKAYNNLPGVDFPGATLSTLYSASSSSNTPTDYSGKTNLAMFRRWKALSRSADSVTKIPNLIRTDLAANAVVGTKSLAGKSGSTGAAGVPVTVYNRRIQYHLAYAVPAMMVLVLLVLLALLASCSALLGRANPAKMKRYLNATSAGRLMTAALHGGAESDMATEAWVKSSGRAMVTVGRGGLKSVVVEDDIDVDSLLEQPTEYGP